jgi:hypothetical protein
MLVLTQLGLSAIIVSPTGSDSGDGSEAHPFATAARAQAALRQLAPHAPASVLFRAGTYELNGTLVLDPRDSDTTWALHPDDVAVGASATLSGGTRVGAWAPASALDARRRLQGGHAAAQQATASCCSGAHSSWPVCPYADARTTSIPGPHGRHVTLPLPFVRGQQSSGSGGPTRTVCCFPTEHGCCTCCERGRSTVHRQRAALSAASRRLSARPRSSSGTAGCRRERGASAEARYKAAREAAEKQRPPPVAAASNRSVVGASRIVLVAVADDPSRAAPL